MAKKYAHLFRGVIREVDYLEVPAIRPTTKKLRQTCLSSDSAPPHLGDNRCGDEHGCSIVSKGACKSPYFDVPSLDGDKGTGIEGNWPETSPY